MDDLNNFDFDDNFDDNFDFDQNLLAIRNPLNNRKNLGDPELELVDPTPNIWEMFQDFDSRFFNGTLVKNGVSVNWSNRMTICAGLCRFHPRTRACEIKLSKPLLQLRPRKDLVETLIHEMIHALLFVTGDSDNRESHGPKFHENMYRINRDASLNISVFHSFHQEVNHFKTHVWRCNGVCKDRHPFYGYVRRSMNRKPGPYDIWWAQHQNTCGGQFVKISEPEKKISNKKENKNGIENKIKDIRTFFSPTKPNANTSGFDNDSNVVSLNPQKTKIEVFKGKGNLLGSDVINPISGKSILLTKFNNSNNNSTNKNSKSSSIGSTATSSTITSISASNSELNNTLNSVFKDNASNITSNWSNIRSNNESNIASNNKSSSFDDNSNNLIPHKSNTTIVASNNIKDTNNNKNSISNAVVLEDADSLKKPIKKLNEIEIVNLESPRKKQRIVIKEPVLIDDDDDFNWLNDIKDEDLIKISQDHSIVIDDDDDEFSWLNNISNEDLLNSSKKLSNPIVID